MLSISIACVAVDIIDQLFNSKILDLGDWRTLFPCSVILNRLKYSHPACSPSPARSPYLFSASNPNEWKVLSGFSSTTEGVFRETRAWPPATQLVVLIFSGSFSNSWRKEKAYPENVVPKSIAATRIGTERLMVYFMKNKNIREHQLKFGATPPFFFNFGDSV